MFPLYIEKQTKALGQESVKYDFKMESLSSKKLGQTDDLSRLISKSKEHFEYIASTSLESKTEI